MELIKTVGLCHVYGEGTEERHEALQNVDMSIEKGEFVAVLGANGSGKSTLAKHFNALLLPTSGHCIVGGMDTAEETEAWRIRQICGMVFQNPDNQIIAATVEDDVAFGLENLGVESSEIRRRVTKALEAVGMEKYRGFAPHLLSGGQKQRVAIAGALAMRTECLVLDEPTAMLDPAGRQEVMSTVKRLHDEDGITIIHITHFMEEAALADHIIVMDDGRVIMDGTPAEIFSHVHELNRCGLGVPVAADMAYRLRRKGIKLPEGILYGDDLVRALAEVTDDVD